MSRKNPTAEELRAYEEMHQTLQPTIDQVHRDQRRQAEERERIEAEIKEATRYKGSLSPLTDAGLDPEVV